MKAFFKKSALPTLAIATALCMGLAACDGTKDPNGKEKPTDGQNITYTVTAECEDALILGGVKVQLKEGTAVAGESSFSKGVATFSLPSATYSVDLVEMSGFEGLLAEYRWSWATVTPEAPNATITILSAEDDDGGNTEKVTYTLTVLLPDNTPVSDIMVQLCGGPSNMCNPRITDASGVAVFELAAGDYEVHIAEADWPSGYTFDDTEYTMGAEGGSLTVYLHAA